MKNRHLRYFKRGEENVIREQSFAFTARKMLVMMQKELLMQLSLLLTADAVDKLVLMKQNSQPVKINSLNIVWEQTFFVLQMIKCFITKPSGSATTPVRDELDDILVFFPPARCFMIHCCTVICRSHLFHLFHPLRPYFPAACTSIRQ